MSAVFYSAVFGVAGAVCLAAVHIVSRIEGFATAPLTYRWMTAGCSFSLVAGVLGVIVALARRRQASPVVKGLIISACMGVALLAVWTQVAALPNYIRDREPMSPTRRLLAPS